MKELVADGRGAVSIPDVARVECAYNSTLDLRRLHLYRVDGDGLAVFIGSWENTREDLARVPEQSRFDWSAASDLNRLNVTHVQETARMLLAAVARGDRSAAEWLADVLNKWWD